MSIAFPMLKSKLTYNSRDDSAPTTAAEANAPAADALGKDTTDRELANAFRPAKNSARKLIYRLTSTVVGTVGGSTVFQKLRFASSSLG